MAQSITTGIVELVDRARQVIEEVDVGEAVKLHAGGDVVIVDIRDVRERKRDGYIPGSFHCPRGMLEFWIDPRSPYHKDVFARDARFLFHCASDWRSALATRAAQDMGLAPVAHIKGGYNAWKAAGGPVTVDENTPN